LLLPEVLPCCPPCGAPRREDYVAVRASAADHVRHAQCPEPIACPACVALSGNPPDAVCVSGLCEIAPASPSPPP
jgi:hypothetical protein